MRVKGVGKGEGKGQRKEWATERRFKGKGGKDKGKGEGREEKVRTYRCCRSQCTLQERSCARSLRVTFSLSYKRSTGGKEMQAPKNKD